MLKKKYTSEEIIEGLLAHNIRIYHYIDAVYCPKVIQYVRQNSGSREEGEELYQDAVHKIYVRTERGKYDPARGSFETYFMLIARGAWLDKLRSRQRRAIQTTPMDDAYEQFSDFDEAEQAEQDLYYHRVQALRQCIARLNQEEQDIIHRFYFSQKSLQVIAQEMDMTYEYARQRIYRIRNKIKKMLGENPNIDLKLVWK